MRQRVMQFRKGWGDDQTIKSHTNVDEMETVTFLDEFWSVLDSLEPIPRVSVRD